MRVYSAAKNSWTLCLAKLVDSHCYQAGRYTTIDHEKYTTYIERNTVKYKCKQQTVWFAAQLSRCCHAPPVNSQPLSSDWVAVVCLFDIFATSIKCVKIFWAFLSTVCLGTERCKTVHSVNFFLEASRLKLEFWKLEMCLSSRPPIFLNKQQLSTKFEYLIKLKMTTRFWLSSLNMNS